MLPKENRLKNTKDIERVFKKGKGLRGGFLFLKFIKNGLRVSRFAFIVSKKSVKGAVRRNRIKRELRDAVQREITRTATGFDLVIVVQKGIENKDFKDAGKDARTLLYKTKLLI